MKQQDMFYCKRMALNMSTQEVADICGVKEEDYRLWENFERYLDTETYQKIALNLEMYIRGLPKDQYLLTRIAEETNMLRLETPEEHAKTLSHLQVHVAKLNLMYVTMDENIWKEV